MINIKKVIYRSVLLFLCYNMSPAIYAQEPINQSNHNDLNTTGTRDFKSNPTDNFGYQHFFQEYQIAENWIFRSEFIQIQTYSYNVIERPLMLRHNLTERFSILFGPKIDIIARGAEGPTSQSFGASFSIGAQYDINENLYIFARYDYQLMGSFPQDHPKAGSKHSFNLGGGFKF